MNEQTGINEHEQIFDLLPLYVAGGLDQRQARRVAQHLPGCAECRAELRLWQTISDEIVESAQAVAAPPHIVERALAQVRRSAPRREGGPAKLRRGWRLVRAQASLVHREIWPGSAAVIGLGYIAALLASQAVFVYALAPLIAAACVALIYGPEADPAYELALATPTSPRQLLLARLALVFGYNLGLVLVATLGLLPILPQPLSLATLGDLVLAWLAPMAFLSAAALLLSLWIGAANAIGLTYVAWLAYLMAGPLCAPQAMLQFSAPLTQALATYQQFWQTPALLLGLAAGLLCLAVWMTGRQMRALESVL